MKKDNQDAIRRYLTAYQEMLQALEVVLTIPATENEAMRRQVDKVRGQNDYLERYQAANASDLSNISEGDRKELLAATQIVKDCWKVIDFWKAKSVLGESRQTLLASREGIQKIIDIQLPAAWNWECDFVFLAGDPTGEIREALRERGLKRLVFLTEDAPKEVEIEQDGEFLTIEIPRLESLPEAFRTFSRPPAWHVYCFNGLSDVEAEAWQQMVKRVRDAFLGYFTGANTLKLRGVDWALQTLRNVPSLAGTPHISAIGDAFEGLPAIIVSPGPSLEKNIQEIPRAKGRALIITSSQCVPVLTAAGIEPDIVVVVDFHDVHAEILSAVAADTRAMLLASAICNPGIFELSAFSRKLNFFSCGPMEYWLSDAFGDPRTSATGGSVAVMAFIFALAWRCDPIVLVGQDLSFEGDKIYARQTNPRHVDLARASIGKHLGGKGGLQVPGYYGGNVRTKQDYYQFRQEFAAIASEASAFSRETRMFNCTEGGAFIDGFDHRPLAEVVTEIVSGGDAAIVADRIAQVPKTVPESRKEVAGTLLENMLKTVDTVIRLTDRHRKLNASGVMTPKRVRQLERIEQELKAAVEEVPPLAIAANTEVDGVTLDATRARDDDAVRHASENLMSMVSRLAQTLRPVIVDSLEKAAAGSFGGDGIMISKSEGPA